MMYQNYRMFMSYWADRLKGDQSHNIFASTNIYNILKYLRVFWDANKKEQERDVKIKDFERILVRKLMEVIENECPDFRIIKKLNPSRAVSLSKDIIIILPSGKLAINENSIEKIDKILELCHEECFKRLVFNSIFDSHVSVKDSEYLTDCILRILVEEHSMEFLDKLPLQSFIRGVVDKYGQQITLALEKDFENHIDVFNSLHRFMCEQLLPAVVDKNDNINNLREQIIGRNYPNELDFKIEYVVNYLREQLKSSQHLIGMDENSKKIILNSNFERLARRIERCFYHYSFVVLIIHIDTFARDRLFSYLFNILKENQFSNFASFYNDKVSPIYSKYRLRAFSPHTLSGIFLDILIVISKFYSFSIPNFSTKLKSIMDNHCSGNSNQELNELITDNSFIIGLRSLFLEEFNNNVSRLVEIIKNISLDKLSEQQRKRIAIQMFLKKLPAKIKGES